MSEKVTNILGYAALAIILAGIWVMFGEDPTKEQGGRGDALFKGAAEKIAVVTTISVKQGGDSLHIDRTDGDKWVVRERSGYPADTALVAKVLRGLVIVERKDPKTTKKDRMVKLGLGEMARTILLSDKDGNALFSFALGKHRTWQGDASLSYIYREKDTRAWEVQGLADFPAEPKSWIQKNLLDIDDSRVKSITYSDGLEFIRKVGADDFVPVEALKAGESFTKKWTVSGDVRTLTHLKADDVQKLMNPLGKAEGRATLVTHDGLTLTYSLFTVDGEKLVKVKATFDPTIAGDKQEAVTKGAEEAEKINQAASPWAYSLSQYDTDILTKARVQLIDQPDTGKVPKK